MGGAPSTSVGPGLGAFVAFLLLALALWLLMRNMNARMRRMAYREQQRVAELEASERRADVSVADQQGEPGTPDPRADAGADARAPEAPPEAQPPAGQDGRPPRPARPRPAAGSQEARDEPTP